MNKTCELCGSEVETIGHTTQSYRNITLEKYNDLLLKIEQLEQELAKHNVDCDRGIL